MKQATHGGPRPGAGRKPSGKVMINANVLPATAAALRREAKRLAKAAGTTRPQLGPAIDAAVANSNYGRAEVATALRQLASDLRSRDDRGLSPGPAPSATLDTLADSLLACP
jgi:hypothetical protein